MSTEHDESGDLLATEEDRERARALLVERFRAGQISFNDYEVRLLLVARAKTVDALYRCTFDRVRSPFLGPRWDRRMRRLDLIAAVICVLSAASALIELWMAYLAGLVAVFLIVVNVGYGVQRLRYRQARASLSRTGHAV